MKNSIAVFLLTAFASVLSAQTTTTYWIVFKDKKDNPYSLSNPEAYLSDRAIARRERQHIPVNSRDLPVNPSYVQTIQSLGGIVKNRSKWYNGVTITLKDETVLNKISSLSFVKSVQKITAITSTKAAEKFKLETEEAAQRTYSYGQSLSQAHMIGADCMHEKGYHGEGMVIAVLDAGFYNVNVLPAFDSIRANNQILGTRDFVSGGTMVYDNDTHGMSVLSCMAGNMPGQLVGTAPKADYWLIRTEDGWTESIQEEINWMVGAEFADSVGADIITSSLGYSRFDDSSTDHTYVDMDGNTTIVTKAADWAASTGMFVVSSAGNSGGPTWYKITAPADADSVLTVGAVDASGNIASFSSRGPTYDGRIKPNVVAQGVNAYCQSDNGSIAGNFNGTSFSCPITAGAVACLWQSAPNKTNMQVMNSIHQSASQSIFPDSIKGYGIPHFCTANFFLVGIDENSLNDEELKVYPNPFNSLFEISFHSARKQDITVELFDITGRKLNSFVKNMEMNSNNKFNIDGEKLSAGIYMLQIRTEDKIFTQKVIKE